MWKAQCILQLMHIAGEDAVLYISVELYVILSYDRHMFLGSIKEVEDPPEKQAKPLLVALFHNFTSSSRLIKRLQSHLFLKLACPSLPVITQSFLYVYFIVPSSADTLVVPCSPRETALERKP